MARVSFTQNIQRHIACPSVRVSATTVREALEIVFTDNPTARGYVLDDRGAVREHMALFVDSKPVRDRVDLSDTVNDDSEIYIMQALSGG